MYLELIGKLIANLWSLETALRFFLIKRLKEEEGFNKIRKVSIGDTLDATHFTNYDSLGKLIERYNKFSTSEENKLNKEKLLLIRDVLAHGRILIDDMEDIESWCLVKFSEVKEDQVTVENKVFINGDEGKWLKESIKYTSDELLKIKFENN